MRILIAEDDPISAHILRSRLREWGYDAVFAADGEEAWELFQADEFSIVLSDWLMPRMDGIELVHRIRSAATSPVHVVLLTAKSETEDLVAGLEAGADDFLTKPFNHQELQVRLRTAERRLALEQRLAAQNSELRAINGRLQRDLEAAARVQRSMLPVRAPRHEKLCFAWEFDPCDELGGDSLNVFQLDREHIGFYVLDVSGHGVAASLLSVAVSRTLAPGHAQDSILYDPDGSILPPHEVLNRLALRFPMNPRAPQYFTLCYGVLNPRNLSLQYSSAGHPGPLLVSPGSVQQLNGTGTPIGFPSDDPRLLHSLKLEPESRFLVFSDGLTDAMNPHGDAFGIERLKSSLHHSRDRSLPETMVSLRSELHDWCRPESPGDDVSCLAIQSAA